jgi:hypothetical protein
MLLPLLLEQTLSESPKSTRRSYPVEGDTEGQRAANSWFQQNAPRAPHAQLEQVAQQLGVTTTPAATPITTPIPCSTPVPQQEDSGSDADTNMPEDSSRPASPTRLVTPRLSTNAGAVGSPKVVAMTKGAGVSSEVAVSSEGVDVAQ